MAGGNTGGGPLGGQGDEPRHRDRLSTRRLLRTLAMSVILVLFGLMFAAHAGLGKENPFARERSHRHSSSTASTRHTPSSTTVAKPASVSSWPRMTSTTSTTRSMSEPRTSTSSSKASTTTTATTMSTSTSRSTSTSTSTSTSSVTTTTSQPEGTLLQGSG
jgi:cytoskeletal protein RodZ